jgi:alpha-tubulin suppressor-like RCC1 family protein
MPIQNRAATAVSLLLLSLSACADPPTASTPAASAPAAQRLLAELRCSVDVAAGALSCVNVQGGGAGGARPTVMTVGGQHHFVRLANSGTVADASTFTTTVTVQNLLLTAMGTDDGTTPHAYGARVFFAAGPTNGVTVANATGTDAFTSAVQPYFQYSGAELGADAVLSPGETSAGKAWTFDMDGASTFAFTVYVQAEVPTGVDATAHFARVTAGGTHSCGLTQAGVAYCWGRDQNGRLGNGTTLTADQGVPSPVQMPAGVTFSSISAGGSHTCAVGSNGRGYCWGSDLNGQLGDGATLTGDQAAPSLVEVPAGVTFSSITAGRTHACAVGSDGRGYCWGNDSSGQLGNGAALTGFQQAASPVEMPAGVTFTTISAGGIHACAVGSDSRGYCWGIDTNGQLGNGAALTGDQVAPSPVEMPAGVTFSTIAAGSIHTCAVGSDSGGYCWGSDNGGRLGNGATLTADEVAPSAVVMPAGVTFSSISAGNSAGSTHTCATGSGPSYCWGFNFNLQVGDGTAASRAAPAVVAATR